MREKIIGKAQKEINEQEEKRLISVAKRLLEEVKRCENNLKDAEKDLVDFKKGKEVKDRYQPTSIYTNTPTSTFSITS